MRRTRWWRQIALICGDCKIRTVGLGCRCLDSYIFASLELEVCCQPREPPPPTPEMSRISETSSRINETSRISRTEAQSRECGAEDGQKVSDCGSSVTDCWTAAGDDVGAVCDCSGSYYGCLRSVRCTGRLKEAADMAAKSLCDGLCR